MLEKEFFNQFTKESFLKYFPLWDQNLSYEYSPIIFICHNSIVLLSVNCRKAGKSAWGPRTLSSSKGSAPPLPTCVVRVPMCSAYNASALLGASLTDHCLQVVELGEP